MFLQMSLLSQSVKQFYTRPLQGKVVPRTGFEPVLPG